MTNLNRRHPVVQVLAGYIAVVLVVALVVAFFWFWRRDWVPDRKTDQLRGATPDQVRELLGEPRRKDAEGRRWTYEHYFYFAEFRVDFGDDDRVEHWSYDR